MSLIFSHRIIFTLKNSTDYIFTDLKMDFESGGYKSGDKLPERLENFGVEATVFMGDSFGFKGCSGYVSFIMNKERQWLYISHPYGGYNKIGHGSSKEGANKDSDNCYDNCTKTREITIQNSKYQLDLSTTDSSDSRMRATFSGPLE